MNPILHTATLGPFEHSLVKQFETYVRKTFGMTLATYLLLELEEGRAMMVEKKSNDYKVMTRWQ